MEGVPSVQRKQLTINDLILQSFEFEMYKMQAFTPTLTLAYNVFIGAFNNAYALASILFSSHKPNPTIAYKLYNYLVIFRTSDKKNGTAQHTQLMDSKSKTKNVVC